MPLQDVEAGPTSVQPGGLMALTFLVSDAAVRCWQIIVAGTLWWWAAIRPRRLPVGLRRQWLLMRRTSLGNCDTTAGKSLGTELVVALGAHKRLAEVSRYRPAPPPPFLHAPPT